MISRLSRQELVKRAEALLERHRPAVVQSKSRFWSDAAEAEYEAWRDGGALPTSAEALEIVEIYIWLEENI